MYTRHASPKISKVLSIACFAALAMTGCSNGKDASSSTQGMASNSSMPDPCKLVTAVDVKTVMGWADVVMAPHRSASECSWGKVGGYSTVDLGITEAVPLGDDSDLKDLGQLGALAQQATGPEKVIPGLGDQAIQTRAMTGNMVQVDKGAWKLEVSSEAGDAQKMIELARRGVARMK